MRNILYGCSFFPSYAPFINPKRENIIIGYKVNKMPQDDEVRDEEWVLGLYYFPLNGQYRYRR
jgi:hypothetical protein